MDRAETVERQMVLALEALQEAIAVERRAASSSSSSRASSSPSNDRQSATATSTTTAVSGLLFPSIRECNAALATFGDAGQLLRALRLFMKMRKAALLARHFQSQVGWTWPIPSPTLVTYSTIMSRANRMGKPRVALRMWKLMQNSPEFVVSVSSSSGSQQQQVTARTILPDIKAVNILVNSYAKLADIEAAQDLLNQMMYGNGTDVPGIAPNMITYNTLMDAAHRAGDLDAALDVMEQIERSGLKPDTWSYTSLIATVARKQSTASGANDPSLAFSLMADMNAKHIRPNGMTYSALIDACGRCGRSDLALKGLRIMLRQKASDQQTLVNDPQRRNTHYKGKPENYSLSNEVGAWTAAINACGKAGRLDAAIQLFYSMPNFGVKPNTVTCGCLTDSLLKGGRIAETLKVLRYMEEHDIAPSEVMYTSLMSSAGRLAEMEQQNEKVLTANLENAEKRQSTNNVHTTPSCDAIEVYTELIKSLMDDPTRERTKVRSEIQDDEDANAQMLVKVFLVFQEMKDAGARPDLACYNALLRACARAGDIRRAQSVLRQLQDDSLEPNDTSWRQLIRAAGNAKRCDIAMSTWKSAMVYTHDIKGHLGMAHSQFRSSQWTPSVDSFSALVSAFVRRAGDPTLERSERKQLYRNVVNMYDRILSGNKDEELGMHRLDANQLQENPRAMLLILQAVVCLEHLSSADGTSFSNARNEKDKLRDTAAKIMELETLRDITRTTRLGRNAFEALRTAQTWKSERTLRP